MFTGLIQAVGHVQHAQARGGDLRLRILVGGLPMNDVQLGESIAVSGVCLTVVEFDAKTFTADVSNETLSLTSLGALPIGAPVNLERALLPTTRLGGHLVAGHVDGMGRVERIWDDGRSQRWRFTAAQNLLRYIAVKGSICVDGVSLTVNAADFPYIADRKQAFSDRRRWVRWGIRIVAGVFFGLPVAAAGLNALVNTLG